MYQRKNSIIIKFMKYESNYEFYFLFFIKKDSLKQTLVLVLYNINLSLNKFTFNDMMEFCLNVSMSELTVRSEIQISN